MAAASARALSPALGRMAASQRPRQAFGDPAPPRTTASAVADRVLSSGADRGNSTSGFGVLTNRFPRAVVWHHFAVRRVVDAKHRGVVTTAPEITMSLGPQAVVASHALAESGLPHPAADPGRSYRR
jgi:hypothetical protein